MFIFFNVLMCDSIFVKFLQCVDDICKVHIEYITENTIIP